LPLRVVSSSRIEVILARILSMVVLKSVAERWSPIVEMAMKDWRLVYGGGRGSEGGGRITRLIPDDIVDVLAT